MNNLRIGIDFIDNKLNTLTDKGIYLLSETSSFIRFSFIFHLLRYNQNFNLPCLYLSAMDLNIENDYIRKKMIELNTFENLTILEIPLYLRNLVNDTNDLNVILNDLDIYFKTINPEIVIIQNVECFFKECNTKSETSHLAFILNYFKKYDATIIIDISNLNHKGKYEYEKFVLGSFDFLEIGKNENYQLTFKDNKINENSFTLLFTTDVELNITVPPFKNTYAISIDNCKYIVMMKDVELYKDFFIETFEHPIQFIFFSSLEELMNLRIDSKHSLIFLPTYLNDFNGWSAIPEIRKKYPHCKILLSGSSHVSAAQKVRAIRLGADKYLIFPCSIDSLKNTLLEMYEQEEKEQQKYLIHRILYSSNEFLKGYKSKNILKKSLGRFIKEFSFDSVVKGMSIYFFKAKIKSEVVDLTDFISNNPQLLFASTYFIGQKPGIFLIFLNINTNLISSKKNEIAQNIKPYLELQSVDTDQNRPMLRKISTLLPRKDKIVNYIQYLNYPLEESDIDVVLDWIYYD